MPISRVLGTGLLFAVLTAACPATLPEDLREGDLVVRTTDSLLSLLSLSLSESDRRFSHVGILVKSGGEEWLVIHARPGEDNQPGVIGEPLETFLAPALRRGYYRLRISDGEALSLSRRAVEWQSQGIPFDHQFDLSNDHALYCTELIWKLVREDLGVDMVPEKSIIRGRLALTMQDLLQSPMLDEFPGHTP